MFSVFTKRVSIMLAMCSSVCSFGNIRVHLMVRARPFKWVWGWHENLKCKEKWGSKRKLLNEGGGSEY